jgi:hypothetical protein
LAHLIALAWQLRDAGKGFAIGKCNTHAQGADWLSVLFVWASNPGKCEANTCIQCSLCADSHLYRGLF